MNIIARLLIIGCVTLFSKNLLCQNVISGTTTIINQQIVNSYGFVDENIAVGQTFVNANFTYVSTFPLGSNTLVAGDKVLIIQMQGATVSTLNNVNFGDILTYGGAGNYEIKEVSTVSSTSQNGSIKVVFDCPFKNDYTRSGRIQIIKIPVFEDLVVATTGKINALDWNGTIGGVLIVEVQNDLVVDGEINADKAGFRGGKEENADYFGVWTDYYYDNPERGNEKGESIHGSSVSYASYRYGRGSIANGGGGGGSHNAGGGGGSNIGSQTVPYLGIGVPTSNAVFNQAWALETPSIAGLVSPGGGRGGYTFGAVADPLTVPPGDSRWGGNNRQNVGGLGGRPLDKTGEKLFLGGGGGAGGGDQNVATPGGNGGGIIMLSAGGSVTGNGQVSSKGEDALPSVGGDAAGGGGGGGAIQIISPVISINVSANGGNGGNQTFASPSLIHTGTGGGGGGGFVKIVGNYTGNVINIGGLNGVSNSPTLASFNCNGATNGAVGDVEILPLMTISNVLQPLNDTLCGSNLASISATLNGIVPNDLQWYKETTSGLIYLQTSPTFDFNLIGEDSCFWVGICGVPDKIEVCAINECLCRDTSLASPIEICPGECIDLNDFYTSTTYIGNDAFWQNSTSDFSFSGDTIVCLSHTIAAGNYNLEYFVYPLDSTTSCPRSNFISITVNPKIDFQLDSIHNYCLSDQTFISIRPSSFLNRYLIDGVVTGSALGFPIDIGIGRHEVIGFSHSLDHFCSTSDTIYFEILPDQIAFFNFPDTVCENSSAINLNSQGRWVINETQEITAGVFDPTFLGPGTYHVALFIDGPCPTEWHDTIVVTDMDRAEIVTQGPFCESLGAVMLELTASSTSNGIWSGVGISDPTGVFNTNLVSPGIHRINYQTNGNCPIDTFFTIETIDKINLSLTTNKLVMCELEDEFRIESNVLGGNFWRFDGQTIIPLTNPITIADLGPGSWDIFYGVEQACGDTSLINIEIEGAQSLVFTGSDTICLGEKAKVFVASNPIGIYTTSCNNCYNNELNEFNSEAAGTGTHSISFTAESLCAATIQKEIEVLPVFIPTLEKQIKACLNDGLLSLNPNNDDIRFLGGIVTRNDSVLPMNLGIGKHTIYFETKGFCSSVDSIAMEIFDLPKNEMIVPENICVPDSIELSLLNDNFDFVTWTIGEQIFKETKLPVKKELVNNGRINVLATIVDQNSCSLSLIKTINAVNNPTALFEVSTNSLSAENTLLKVESQSINSDSNKWNFGKNSNPFESFESKVEVLLSTGVTSNDLIFESFDSVEVYLVAYNDFCTDTSWKKLAITEEFTFFLPNAFTPGRGTLNNTFPPQGLNHICSECLNDYRFRIFNRWGEMVFSTDNPYHGWDGTFNENGILVQQDVYVYSISYRNPKNRRMNNYTGTVTLLR